MIDGIILKNLKIKDKKREIDLFIKILFLKIVNLYAII